MLSKNYASKNKIEMSKYLLSKPSYTFNIIPVTAKAGHSRPTLPILGAKNIFSKMHYPKNR